MPDKKPSLAVILGGPMPHKGAAPEDDGEEQYDGLSPEEREQKERDAAEEFISAVKSGDSAKLLQAFKALHGLDHAAWDSEDDDEHEEDDE